MYQLCDLIVIPSPSSNFWGAIRFRPAGWLDRRADSTRGMDRPEGWRDQRAGLASGLARSRGLDIVDKVALNAVVVAFTHSLASMLTLSRDLGFYGRFVTDLETV